MRTPATPNLINKFEDEPEKIVAMRKYGVIPDAEFKKYGPLLV
jgi:hypothetical protein